ncbi:MAG: type II secretion system minor pseudopilin GspK [Desulfobulbus sp.]|jgi:general secretion pathway protein K
MRLERLGGQAGMALVLTLLVVAFLVTLTVQLMAVVDRQMSGAALQAEQVRLDAMVLGGLHLVKAALIVDRGTNAEDGPHDAWADFDRDALAALGGDISLEIEVVDLAGRLQINALVGEHAEACRRVWRRFLLSGRFAVRDEEHADALLDALTDWIDQDEEELPQGAETPYYQGLSPSRACRNGPMLFPEELLEVRGMTAKIVYGDEASEGIFPYVTIRGDDGRINLNTAPAAVLEALHEEMTPELARAMVDFRTDTDNREALAKADWYREVEGMPATLDLGNDLPTVKGSYFLARIRAVKHRYGRVGQGVLHRTGGGLRVLSWNIKAAS